jgi:23S rRNA-/tRNA-specific pseudouridylate synthase
MSSTVHQNSSDTTSAVDAISSPPPPLQNPLFRVLYMTDEMVVVDKPHGVPKDGVHHPHTVEKWIQSQMKSDEEARDDTIMKNAGAAEEDTTAVGGSSSLWIWRRQYRG